MASITGTTPVMAPISPGLDDRNEYPTHKSLWGQGGFDRVTKSVYDSMPNERRRGKVVQVVDYDVNGLKTFYHSDDENATPQEIELGSGGTVDLTALNEFKRNVESDLPRIKKGYYDIFGHSIGAGLRASVNSKLFAQNFGWVDLVFDNKEVDVGLDYDSSTGIFTMPKAGVIHMTLQLKSGDTLQTPFNGYEIRIVDVDTSSIITHYRLDSSGWIQEFTTHITIPGSVQSLDESYNYQIGLDAGQKIKVQFMNKSHAITLAGDTKLIIDTFQGSALALHDTNKKLEDVSLAVDTLKQQLNIAANKKIVVDANGNITTSNI